MRKCISYYYDHITSTTHNGMTNDLERMGHNDMTNDLDAPTCAPQVQVTFLRTGFYLRKSLVQHDNTTLQIKTRYCLVFSCPCLLALALGRGGGAGGFWNIRVLEEH